MLYEITPHFQKEREKPVPHGHCRLMRGTILDEGSKKKHLDIQTRAVVQSNSKPYLSIALTQEL